MDFYDIFDDSPKEFSEKKKKPKARDRLEQDIEIERLQNLLKNVNRYSGTVKANTLKELKSGEPIEEIFLKLCEGVSLMTGEPLFYEEVKKIIN